MKESIRSCFDLSDEAKDRRLFPRGLAAHDEFPADGCKAEKRKPGVREAKAIRAHTIGSPQPISPTNPGAAQFPANSSAGLAKVQRGGGEAVQQTSPPILVQPEPGPEKCPEGNPGDLDQNDL